jgi:hypothetical protein
MNNNQIVNKLTKHRYRREYKESEDRMKIFVIYTLTRVVAMERLQSPKQQKATCNMT